MGTQSPHIDIDIAIIGGGIAGLWSLNRLRQAGYSAVLFEETALGSFQTIGSQGIIHGGLKYALSGRPGAGAATLAAMPAVWRDCLAGRGQVDLRGCRVLSDSVHLWSSGSLASRLGAFFGSRLLHGQAEALEKAEFPAPLQAPAFAGQVYRLADLVVDVPSLLQTLAGHYRESLYRIDWRQAALENIGGRAQLSLPQCTIIPQRVLLCAGAGNAGLIAALGCKAPAMQLRPLQQVLVKHSYPQPFYAHCIGAGASPRLSVSSHTSADGTPLWYLGGDLATAGATATPEQLIAHAKSELAELLPWLELGASEWTTLALDRAEPRQSALLRPAGAFLGEVQGVDNTLVAWPTKLCLSPALGESLLKQLQRAGVVPRHQPNLAPLQSLGSPPVATPYWDTLFP